MKKLGLTNNQLKIIAIITMTVDHVGVELFPEHKILRIIGRLAFPLFAYMISEGFYYTRSRKRYFFNIFLLGAFCQTVFFIAEGSLYQNILLTFSLSIATMLLIDNFRKKKDATSTAFLVLWACFLLFVSVILPCFISGFQFDYGIVGILTPVVLYLVPSGKYNAIKVFFLAIMLAFLSLSLFSLQWYSLFSLPLLLLYNGERGRANLKYLFYLFYPAHIFIIYLIDLLFL